MAWQRWDIEPTSGNQASIIVQNSTAADGDDGQFSLRHGSNNKRFEFWVTTQSDGRRRARSVNNVADLGVWNFVAGVYDGTAIRLYLNGQFEEATPLTGNILAFSAALLTQIGRSAAAEQGFRAFNGAIDEVRIYPRALTQAEIVAAMQYTRPCQSHDHYRLSHVGATGGFGVTCQAESVTITARDPAHALTPPPSGTVLKISTVPAVTAWALQTGNPAAFTHFGGGLASYVFNGAESEIVLRMTQTTAGIVNINLLDSAGIVEAAIEDPPLEFRDAAFAFSPVNTQIAGKPSDVAPNAQVLTLRAIETNSDTGACQALLSGPQSVESAFQCVDPSTCAPSSAGAVDDTAVPANPFGSLASFGTVNNLVFDATGTATFALRYDDARQVSLHARKVFATPPMTLTGASNAFVSRPFALRPRANRLSGAPNPGAADAGGPVFEVAGQPFEVTVDAVAWQAADDASPRDGVADSHETGDRNPADNANLADNPSTGNFFTVTQALLGSYLYLPNANFSGPPDDPGLGGGATLTNFAAGSANSTSVLFDEVGIIEIEAAQGGDYLGIGAATTANVRGLSGGVGRFIPAWFTLAPGGFALRNGPSAPVNWDCAFTYIGQPFEYAGTPTARRYASRGARAGPPTQAPATRGRGRVSR